MAFRLEYSNWHYNIQTQFFFSIIYEFKEADTHFMTFISNLIKNPRFQCQRHVSSLNQYNPIAGCFFQISKQILSTIIYVCYWYKKPQNKQPKVVSAIKFRIDEAEIWKGRRKT